MSLCRTSPMGYQILECPQEIQLGQPLVLKILAPVGRLALNSLLYKRDWIGIYPQAIPSVPSAVSQGRWVYIPSPPQLSDPDDQHLMELTVEIPADKLPPHAGVFEARIHPDQRNPLIFKTLTKAKFSVVKGTVSRVKRTIFLILLGIAVAFSQQLLNAKGVCKGSKEDPIHLDTIQDEFVRLTQPINDYFHDHPDVAQAAQAISSFLIDITMGMLIFVGGFRRSTVRPFFAMAMLIYLRFIAQSIATFPCPAGYLWPSGSLFGYQIPTLFVDYHPANDFFFSGHCGTIVVAIIELMVMDYWRTAIFELLVVLPFVSTLVVVYRVHRGTDVFTAIIAGIAACAISEQFISPIDNLLLIAEARSGKKKKKTT